MSFLDMALSEMEEARERIAAQSSDERPSDRRISDELDLMWQEQAERRRQFGGKEVNDIETTPSTKRARDSNVSTASKRPAAPRGAVKKVPKIEGLRFCESHMNRLLGREMQEILILHGKSGNPRASKGQLAKQIAKLDVREESLAMVKGQTLHAILEGMGDDSANPRSAKSALAKRIIKRLEKNPGDQAPYEAEATRNTKHRGFVLLDPPRLDFDPFDP